MAAPPAFSSRDPLSPRFWDERFERGFTPWERGSVPLALRRFVAASSHLSVIERRSRAVGNPISRATDATLGSPPSRGRRAFGLSDRHWPPAVLLPGCGSARELALMCEAGWDATAIDFSHEAVARARALAGPWADCVVQADFFAYAPPRPLDVVYEQAFLCALPPARRPDVARRWADLLGQGGLLAGYFYFDDAPKGPPFGIARAGLDALLTPAFGCVADEAVEDSIPVFAGKERWMIWRRR